MAYGATSASLPCANAADPAAPSPFKPSDISIGEPIALPFSPPTTAPVPAATPIPAAGVAAPPAGAARPTGAIPGTGWLGFSVAESNVPGRWRVDEVVAGGPAARNGLLPGDDVRAVNGTEFKSLDEVTQAITSIAAGQDVRMAVGRADQVRDVVLKAEPRPTQPSREWQPAPETPPQTAGAGGLRTLPAEDAVPSRELLPEPLAAAPADPVGSPTQAAPRFAAPPARPFDARPQPAAPPFAAAPPVVAPAIPGPSRPSPAPDLLPGSGALPPAAQASQRGRTALGVRTLPIDPATQARFNLPQPAGAYVVGVVQDLPASKAGVPPGSVIVALGDRPVRSPLELTQLVTSGPVDRPTTLEFVLPGGQSKRARVVLQALEAPLERALIGGLESATAVPSLEPGPTPTRAERPPTIDAATLRGELRRIRSQLDSLERSLDGLP